MPELTNPVIISDVHLAANKPKTIMAFLRFMKNVAPRFAELVILGDLFDYWLGDDATPEADPIIAELKLYSSTGRRVLIMQGSHDALLGADFAESCGAELIADQIVIPVNGNPILFAYGDQWCVRDQVRQARRAVLRDPIWQESLLAQPAHERAAVIDEALRKCATENEAPKNPRDFDVIESAVAESARAAGVELVIHGHTHHPGAHVNAVIERWVLPDCGVRPHRNELQERLHHLHARRPPADSDDVTSAPDRSGRDRHLMPGRRKASGLFRLHARRS